MLNIRIKLPGKNVPLKFTVRCYYWRLKPEIVLSYTKKVVKIVINS